MKVLGLIGVFILVAACNNAAPTATTYKTQLGGGTPAGAAATPGGATTPGGANAGATAGNPALGLAAFSNSCVGCHAFSGGLVIDGTKDIPGAATKAAHSGVADIFKSSAADITALFKGDSAKGDAYITSKCTGCHNGTVQVELDSFAGLDGQDKNPVHASFGADMATNMKDIAASLVRK